MTLQSWICSAFFQAADPEVELVILARDFERSLHLILKMRHDLNINTQSQ
jgi:hypothetical protein